MNLHNGMIQTPTDLGSAKKSLLPAPVRRVAVGGATTCLRALAAVRERILASGGVDRDTSSTCTRLCFKAHHAGDGRMAQVADITLRAVRRCDAPRAGWLRYSFSDSQRRNANPIWWAARVAYEGTGAHPHGPQYCLKTMRLNRPPCS